MKPRATAGLGDLAGLKRALQTSQREAAEREAKAHAERERERQARDLFANSVGAVTPLPKTGRKELRAAPPEPEPRQRQRDEAAALRETLSDAFDVDSLLETDAARQRGLYHQAQQRVDAAVGGLQPIAQVLDTQVLRRAVKGYVGHPAGATRLREVFKVSA